MKYEEFKDRVVRYINSISFNNHNVKYRNDVEKGMYIARVCGILIMGCATHNTLTVKWGSGHQAVIRG